MKSKYKIHQGDCLDHLDFIDDNSIDSIVTDPPYGLEFMGKDWDAPWKSDRRQVFDGTLTDVRENPFGRSKVRYGTGASYGAGVQQMHAFQEWATVIFAECLRVLKPGGHLLSFGGSRTYHRMASAVEDAGFEIRDQIMWVYGSGFPKSHNGEWGGTALKPAHEPIVMARKPLIGTVEKNFSAHGTGALNIDGCRVATDPSLDDPRLGGAGAWKTDKAAQNVYEGGYAGDTIASSALGRWPANLIHDGSDEVLAAFPQAKGQQGSLSGKEPSSKTLNTFGEFATRSPSEPRGDAGSAARFFYCAKASKADRDEGMTDSPDRVLAMSNQAKAQLARGVMHEGESGMNSAKVRKNSHPTVKPADLMAYLCRLVTPPGGVVLDPFMGSGSTGKAAVREGFRFIGIEREAEYCAIARARIEDAVRQMPEL